MTARVPIATLLAAVVLAACGGGGGGGPTAPPVPPTPEPATIKFSTDGGGSNTIALVQVGDESPDSLFLNLEATEVSDLYAIAFDLAMPTTVLELVSVGEGGFLDEMGAAPTSFQLVDDGAGRLVVGLTRLGGGGGVNGSGTLLMFEFARAAVGEGVFALVDTSALDRKADPIDGVTWFGGTVSVPDEE
ncbi:MAG: hypothetical protein VYE73_08355 [Acidobacteriota bacterium]|nr:hypothetical protein [Acidobacteriota bacterium]